VSYLLYINWKPSYALILLGVTVVTYCSAILLEKSNDKYKKAIINTGGVILTILPLLIFKYYNFINETVYSVLFDFGLRMKVEGLNWALPIGISFFTFQALGYMIDVRTKKISAEKNFLDYALFVGFFPQIASGPISKAGDFLPQIKMKRPFVESFVSQGMKYLLWGMFLKIVVADRVGIYVDAVYNNYEFQNGVSCFIASILYSIQIYSDFAGYSLMAIGVARILGFDLINNFRRPYFSVSVTDFWRRWHISLSTWLKDYIYIPLGGSRNSKARTYWNIFVTFLVSGIWHGASWTFIVWGVFHGLAQIIEKMIGCQKYEKQDLGRAFRILITFLIVNFAWIFFRMPTLSDGCNVIIKIFTQFTGIPFLPAKGILFYMLTGVLMLFMKDFYDEFYPNKLRLFDNKRFIVRYTCYFVTLFIMLLIGVFDSGQFIYFKF